MKDVNYELEFMPSDDYLPTERESVLAYTADQEFEFVYWIGGPLGEVVWFTRDDARETPAPLLWSDLPPDYVMVAPCQEEKEGV